MMCELQHELTPVVLLDIEGTTTLISFVKEKLFPFARDHLQRFLVENWADPEIQSIVGSLRKQCGEDSSGGLQGVPQILCSEEANDEVIKSVITNVLWQMDNDRKTTALKALQGKIWKFGFESGILLGHVFDDVPRAFERWTANSKKIYIYSSGSVEAQKLLFRYSTAGNLREFITGYFDTTSGAKIEFQSYHTIAENVNDLPTNITFFTDIPSEAAAATEAGLKVVLMVRPGNSPLAVSETLKYEVAINFDQYY